MEAGAAVWVKDEEGDEAWIAGTVLEKSAEKPFTVKIEVDEEFSEEPLTFTFDDGDGEGPRERQHSHFPLHVFVFRNVSVYEPKMPTDFSNAMHSCVYVEGLLPSSLQRQEVEPRARASRLVMGASSQRRERHTILSNVIFFRLWRP